MCPKQLIQLSWQLPLLLCAGLIALPDVPLVHPLWGFWPLWLISPALVTYLTAKVKLTVAPLMTAQVLVFPVKRSRARPSSVRMRRAA